MRKIYVVLIILAIDVSFYVGYAFTIQKLAPQNNDGLNKHKPPEQIKQNQKRETDPIKKQIESMTIDEKIGQIVIAGVDGYTFNNNARKLIQDFHVGGIIIMGKNVKNTNQLLKLINSIKNANIGNDIPLFMAVDQEGGRIDRMPPGFKRFPTNKEIGKIKDSSFSYSIGSLIAEEIKSFGFNMDFAPVLDINSNPKNPIIGDRSFGSNAEIVSRLGVQTMKGIMSQNVIPVVKHFPGHGDTSLDSHIDLPVVNNSLERLKSFEFIPFTDAIKNDADAVMVSHLLLPKIDANNPASFSKIIITNILRGQLKFDGVVITDDMTMGSIVKNFDIGEAAVKSINSGVDIILIAHGYENEVTVINALKKAVDNGTISTQRVDESVYRIIKLKQKYNLKDEQINSIDVNGINSKIKDVLSKYGF